MSQSTEAKGDSPTPGCKAGETRRRGQVVMWCSGLPTRLAVTGHQEDTVGDDTVSDLDAALDAFNVAVQKADDEREAEQENTRHWLAFDLAAEFAAQGVSFAEAYAMLRRCRWSARRARQELWAKHAPQPA